jgi:hypothetical protein
MLFPSAAFACADQFAVAIYLLTHALDTIRRFTDLQQQGAAGNIIDDVFVSDLRPQRGAVRAQ